MKIKLIQTTNYLLLIDEEAEIKDGDKVEFDCGYAYNPCIVYDNSIDKEDCKKLIAYYPLTKEAKELDGLPLLPNPFEKDIEDNPIIHDWVQEVILEEGRKWNDQDALEQVYYGIVKGYKAAQSKQFSLEDIERAMIEDLTIEQFWEKCVLSTQQLPKEFIPEYEEYFDQDSELGDDWGHKSIKKRLITTNSEGKQVLVGTYKYK